MNQFDDILVVKFAYQNILFRLFYFVDWNSFNGDILLVECPTKNPRSACDIFMEDSSFR